VEQQLLHHQPELDKNLVLLIQETPNLLKDDLKGWF
jgi:hypothetical protein